MSKPDRTQYEVSLMPEELVSIAYQLSPSVQMVSIPTLYPGGVRIPTWAALVLVGGEVEGSIHDSDPLEAYACGCEVLAQIVGDHFVEPAEMVEPSLFGGGA